MRTVQATENGGPARFYRGVGRRILGHFRDTAERVWFISTVTVALLPYLSPYLPQNRATTIREWVEWFGPTSAIPFALWMLTAVVRAIWEEASAREQSAREEGATGWAADADPYVAAVVVNAAGSVLSTLLGRFRPGEKRVAAAGRVVQKIYDQLRQQITDASMRVLVLLESGENQHPEQVRDKLKELTKKQDASSVRRLESDPTYRLKFLCLLGLLTPVGSEYAISELGHAFLAEVRSQDIHYKNVLRR